MAVISVSITQSVDQIVSGIPRQVSITVNIPSTIFYTFNGTDPTVNSPIYVGTLILPTNSSQVILKIFATNGVDSSPIVVESYETNVLNNTRLPRSSTDAPAESSLPSLYPFGDGSIQPNTHFFNPGDAGTTVNNPALPSASTGFDSSGNPGGFTNKPFDLQNYDVLYSETDDQHKTGRGVGNLPAQVTIQVQPPPPTESEVGSALFDPRAFVIFHDVAAEDPNDPPLINKQFFSLENPDKIRDGNNYYNQGLNAPTTTGSFLRSHYNPRDHTITYYYYDSIANKWIISKTPYTPTNPTQGQLYNISLSREKGAGFVFTWQPGARRVLF